MATFLAALRKGREILVPAAGLELLFSGVPRGAVREMTCKRPIDEINQIDIRNVLAPIWHTKADTARKAHNRIGIVFRHAAAMGLNVDLQATDKAKALLGVLRHVVTHIVSVPWQDVPAFYASLAEPSITHLALRLLILTAGTRSKPLRHLRLDQIDGDVWRIAGEDMKGRKGKTPDFAVPLAQRRSR